ncbi:MAG: acyl-CoA dehydrogenase family protein, partial [Candidatus Binataceae bacterium]
RDGMSDRESWRKLGAAGFLGPNAPAEYGGGGVDFLFDAIVVEEMARVRAHGLMMALHSDVCMPYITSYGTEAQKHRYLPGACSGDLILAIGMTEPGTGSDLAAVKTNARRDGDSWVINGAKTFISNGQISDAVILVVKTDTNVQPGHRGISLIMVDRDSPGFVRGRKLDKLGFKGQDTSELFFEDCRVPLTNLLGQEGQGFKMLMEKLQQERLTTAVGSLASARRCLDDTIAYTKQRRAFGQPIANFQNTQFKLAEMATEIEAARQLMYFVATEVDSKRRCDKEASMAKLFASEMAERVTSQALQIHGGYGYTKDFPLERYWRDARLTKIFECTSEIQLRIISDRLLPRARK